MSVELKEFGGAYFPKDKALKKNPELKPLAILIKALNKGIAEAVIFGKLAAEHPEHIDDYFKVKIWEHREDLPCPELDVLSPDFFGSSVVWNVNAGEPAAAPQPEDDENQNHSDDRQAEEMKSVRLLDQHSRAACLALFGPVEEITAAQYGQIVDLINDDQSSFEQNLAEALTKETRALALAPERQAQLLAWVREKASETAQWPDIKKLLAKWIDTPPEKRELSTTSGDNENADRNNTMRLQYNIARGIIARSMDFDINNTPLGIEQRANSMLSDKNDTVVSSWFLPLSRTPGVYDLHPAAIISMVKTCDDHLHIYPGELRKYIDAFIASNDCINPDPLLVDIACGRSSLPVPHQETTDEETRPLSPGEADAPANKPLSDKEFNADIDRAIREQAGASQQPSNDAEKHEVPPALSDREIEIAHALNDLISGRTGIMGKEEAEGVVICTGHSIADVLPALITDIVVTELCLSPNFSDDEIHNVATDIIDVWSDDLNVRQKVALDGIVEYRRPIPPKSSAPVTTIRTSNDAAPEQLSAPAPTTLTYQQQLTIAALQGLCANPAYSAISDELPEMACLMARAIITEEAAQ
ncbi:exonuclease family protein [Lelliottia wanjuensis]|uniref:Exodeoxyribonuclease VIII n=1 Tax=Lelliottia wanjuensis TaxID=3050585 RepID=A0AAP4D342_9ENTR|nr:MULTISPECIES: exodeoxyribonuclease VIII [unclassified Lelliottia]MDK9364209.1 exodeoxyribonuclease VIII [Lelliottia sp. V106_12]MDK9617114.1 exodeoxyribonuclease VIII [Lelliottia sp. V106_9]